MPARCVTLVMARQFMSLDLASRMRAAESSAPCSSPSNWTRDCGTHAELAQAMKTYNSAPKTKDAWASSGGMPVRQPTPRVHHHPGGCNSNHRCRAGPRACRRAPRLFCPVLKALRGGALQMVAGTKRAEMAAHAGKFVLGK
jgi:hypothetical protein